MIEIALTPNQRKNSLLADLRSEIIRDPVVENKANYQRLMGGISNPDVHKLLAESAKNDTADAPEALFNVFQHLIEWLRDHALYRDDNNILTEDQRKDASVLGIDPFPNYIDATTADILWGNLEDDIALAAERLWRDQFISYSTIDEAKRAYQDEDNRKTLLVLARWSRQYLLLAIEVAIYALRSEQNFAPFQLQRNSGNKSGIRQRIADDIIKPNMQRHLDWDAKELHPLLGKKFFEEDFGDSERMKALASLFGPDKTASREVGWVRYAEDAKEELFIQCFDLRLRLYRKNRQPFRWLWNAALRVTTMYGTSPGRFAWVGSGTICLFAAIFFLNDLGNNGIFAPQRACFDTQTHGMSWLEMLIHYFYLAVTNITSLGSTSSQAQYCGGAVTSLIIITATLTGYFLLATLAALIIQKLTESER